MNCRFGSAWGGVFILCLLSMALMSIESACAMAVSPIVLDVRAAGGANNGQISVLNDGAKPVPVEIVISRIEISEDGEITSKPSTDEFLVFPPQAIIKPGATQSFRVQWVGNTQINTSQTFNVSVNQVPVKMPAGKSGVQVVFNFGCIVNVAPLSGKSSIDLVSSGVSKDEKGKIRPVITVKNTGNIHSKLTDSTIKLASGTWQQTITPAELRQLLGIGLVQPGKSRRFLLPIEIPANVGSITASIEYKPGN